MSTRPLSKCAAGAAIVLALVLPQGSAAAGPAAPRCAEGPVTIAGTIYGTSCADVIVAPPGVADVKGGGGDDVIVPAPALASAPCPEGCRLGIGSQTFEGGPGDDVVYGERGNDRLYGGEGNDRLYGGVGDDLLRGGPGDDLLSGGFGADSIDGEEGSDYVRGDGTADTIVDSGGGGDDTLSYSTGIAPGFFNSHSPPLAFSSIPGLPALGGERGVYIDLTGSEIENGDDGVASYGGGIDKVAPGAFETVIGTAFSDYMIGSARDESFYGGGGGDVILGGDGEDRIFGGAEGDHLDGGPGIDTIDGGPGSDHCASPEAGVSCERGAGEEGVVQRDQSKVAAGLVAPGEARYDQLYLNGSSGADHVTASYAPGAVTFGLGAGSTAPFDSSASASEGCEPPSGATLVCPLAKPLDSLVISGFDGDDSLEATNLPSAVAVVIAGGEGDDSIVGGDQSEDVLVDGTDKEGGGDDILKAGGGDDALLNNGGSDQLSGGPGNDLFLSGSTCDGDALDGGPDRDNASWAKFQGAGVVARLDQGRAGGLGDGVEPDCPSGSLDALTGIEDLEGSGGSDVFYGDGADNQLLGWEGEDVYSAGSGEDRILANSGDYDPRIECGEGEDTAFIDFPVLEPHDVAAPDCEEVHEAAKNSFRFETEFEVPPAPEAPQPPPIEPQQNEPLQRKPLQACLAGPGRGLRCVVRPRHMGFGALGRVDGIRWRHWGARRTIGFGRLTILAGRGRSIGRAAARVRVGEPEFCESRRWYRRVTVTYGRRYTHSFIRGSRSQTPCG
jgi:Ca2+-binding RTX toxin-like protein